MVNQWVFIVVINRNMGKTLLTRSKYDLKKQPHHPKAHQTGLAGYDSWKLWPWTQSLLPQQLPTPFYSTGMWPFLFLLLPPPARNCQTTNSSNAVLRSTWNLSQEFSQNSSKTTVFPGPLSCMHEVTGDKTSFSLEFLNQGVCSGSPQLSHSWAPLKKLPSLFVSLGHSMMLLVIF